MKLTRLRLIGFKSFVEPTDLEIEPGLTGVVGPNGCGKSNLVEAVRWVMGEASHKAMRASEMDDVIFSGNTERPARNHAEVSVLVDNSDRTAPAAFNDTETLEVSRRIMREHGSVFRVNSREVRARDVTVLFADASTGSRSPALVHQGRIGEIIQARPDQRRRVLEEAAGISGLHARRHEAELRLRAAEQNLARAEDVIGRLPRNLLRSRPRRDRPCATATFPDRCAEPRRCCCICAGPAHKPKSPMPSEPKRSGSHRCRAHSEQTVATTRQAEVAAGLPPLREAEARAAAALQRLLLGPRWTGTREIRARSDWRTRSAPGTIAADLDRERTLAADAAAALDRLDTKQKHLKAKAQASAERLTA